MSRFTVFFLLQVLCITPLFAQGFEFTRIEQATTDPGGMEFEMLSSHCIGKDHAESVHLLGLKQEYGVTPKLMAAFTIGMTQAAFSSSNESEVGYDLTVGTAWKYRLVDSSMEPWGLALCTELGACREQALAVLRVVMDTDLGQHKLAFNLRGEAGYSYGTGEDLGWNIAEVPVDFLLGYMYRFSTRFHAGVELIQRTRVLNGSFHRHTLECGPTFAVMGDGWFLLVNALPRLDRGLAMSGSVDRRSESRVDALLQLAVAL